MTNFLEKYETVDSRIHRFWSTFPDGAIRTYIEQLQLSDTGRFVQVLVKAEIYKNAADPLPAAIDYAEEILNASPVNRTSFIENAVTSAIGRGLATLGFSPKGADARPTVTEMQKAERVGQPQVIRGKGNAVVRVEPAIVPAAGKQKIDAVVLQTKRFAEQVKTPHTPAFTLGLLTLALGRDVSDVNTLNIEECEKFLNDAKSGFQDLKPRFQQYLTDKGAK